MNFLIRRPSQFVSAFRSTVNVVQHNKSSWPSLTTSSRSFASPPSDQAAAAERDRPVKYSTSQAAGLAAHSARQGSFNYYDTPWYQRHVVVFSTAIFMIYFFILREENDIDQQLERSLFESVPGLEETQLILNYKYNLEHNLDNKAVVQRMKELGVKPEDIHV